GQPGEVRDAEPEGGPPDGAAGHQPGGAGLVGLVAGMAEGNLDGYPADNHVHDSAGDEPGAGERVHITGVGGGPGNAPGIRCPIARYPCYHNYPSPDRGTGRAPPMIPFSPADYWLGCGSSHETLGFAPT